MNEVLTAYDLEEHSKETYGNFGLYYVMYNLEGDKLVQQPEYVGKKLNDYEYQVYLPFHYNDDHVHVVDYIMIGDEERLRIKK